MKKGQLNFSLQILIKKYITMSEWTSNTIPKHEAKKIKDVIFVRPVFTNTVAINARHYGDYGITINSHHDIDGNAIFDNCKVNDISELLLLIYKQRIDFINVAYRLFELNINELINNILSASPNMTYFHDYYGHELEAVYLNLEPTAKFLDVVLTAIVDCKTEKEAMAQITIYYIANHTYSIPDDFRKTLRETFKL